MSCLCDTRAPLPQCPFVEGGEAAWGLAPSRRSAGSEPAERVEIGVAGGGEPVSAGLGAEPLRVYGTFSVRGVGGGVSRAPGGDRWRAWREPCQSPGCLGRTQLSVPRATLGMLLQQLVVDGALRRGHLPFTDLSAGRRLPRAAQHDGNRATVRALGRGAFGGARPFCSCASSCARCQH